MASDVIKLLQKRNISQEFPEYTFALYRVDDLHDAYLAAKSQYDQAVKRLEKACKHPIILELKGGYGYSAGGTRVCYVCKLKEEQPIDTPGDEYDYAIYGAYTILTGSQYGYMPDEGREVYQVSERKELFIK